MKDGILTNKIPSFISCLKIFSFSLNRKRIVEKLSLLLFNYVIYNTKQRKAWMEHFIIKLWGWCLYYVHLNPNFDKAASFLIWPLSSKWKSENNIFRRRFRRNIVLALPMRYKVYIYRGLSLVIICRWHILAVCLQHFSFHIQAWTRWSHWGTVDFWIMNASGPVIVIWIRQCHVKLHICLPQSFLFLLRRPTIRKNFL